MSERPKSLPLTVAIAEPKRNACGEYVVRVWVGGVRCPDRDYHTDCRVDAFGTMAAMRAEARARGEHVVPSGARHFSEGGAS